MVRFVWKEGYRFVARIMYKPVSEMWRRMEVSNRYRIKTDSDSARLNKSVKTIADETCKGELQLKCKRLGRRRRRVFIIKGIKYNFSNHWYDGKAKINSIKLLLIMFLRKPAIVNNLITTAFRLAIICGRLRVS